MNIARLRRKADNTDKFPILRIDCNCPQCREKNTSHWDNNGGEFLGEIFNIYCNTCGFEISAELGVNANITLLRG